MLENKEIERDEMVWEVGFAWVVRLGKWKLKVVTDQTKADRISKKQRTVLGEGIELFDLEIDGSEQTNLANKYPEIVEQLAVIYNEWKVMVTI